MWQSFRDIFILYFSIICCLSFPSRILCLLSVFVSLLKVFRPFMCELCMFIVPRAVMIDNQKERLETSALSKQTSTRRTQKAALRLSLVIPVLFLIHEVGKSYQIEHVKSDCVSIAESSHADQIRRKTRLQTQTERWRLLERCDHSALYCHRLDCNSSQPHTARARCSAHFRL